MVPRSDALGVVGTPLKCERERGKVGVNDYHTKNQDYLNSQIGNPDGEDVPNKKYYDPRKWMLEGENAMIERLRESFTDLNNINTNV